MADRRLPFWIAGWIVISSVICTIDALFVLLRPHTLPGGSLNYLFKPCKLRTASLARIWCCFLAGCHHLFISTSYWVCHSDLIHCCSYVSTGYTQECVTIYDFSQAVCTWESPWKYLFVNNDHPGLVIIDRSLSAMFPYHLVYSKNF